MIEASRLGRLLERDPTDKEASAQLETILRRGVACGMGTSRLMAELFFYSAAHRIEHMHPLQECVLSGAAPR